MTLLKYGLGLPIGVRVIRKCAIPKPIILKPVTLGQHLKQHRDKQKLRQKDVAAILGIGHFTYMTWEKDQATPIPRYYPAIIDWLGYNPLPRPETEGDELRHTRLKRGQTAQEAADECGIDESTWLAFERGTRDTIPEVRKRLVGWMKG